MSTGLSSSVREDERRGSLPPPYVFTGAPPGNGTDPTADGGGHPAHGGTDGNQDEDEEERARREEARAATEQAAQGGGIIADDEDIDAGYESDTRSWSSVSLTSNTYEFVYENGRRYHSFREGRYNFPNDDEEYALPPFKTSRFRLTMIKGRSERT